MVRQRHLRQKAIQMALEAAVQERTIELAKEKARADIAAFRVEAQKHGLDADILLRHMGHVG